MKTQDFQKLIHNTQPIFLILSKDSEEIRELTKKFIQNHSSAEVIRINGETATNEALLSELNTLPFIAEKRLIVLSQIDQLKAPVKEALTQYLTKPNTMTLLFMTGESLAANTKLYKSIDQAGAILDLRKDEKPWEREKSLSDWASRYVSEFQKKISFQAAKSLVSGCCGDRSTLKQELDKLICFVGDRNEITERDIEAICIRLPNDTIWQLGDAILSRQPAEALKVAHSLMINGTELLGIVAAIRSQIRKGFHICSIMESGADLGQITQAYPYLKGNFLNKQMQLSQSYGSARFRQALIHLDRAEASIKNSVADATTLAERLILGITK